MDASVPDESAPRWQLLLAFAGLYVIWGSTYLGIKVAVETIPPFLMSGMRFVPAGIFLYAIARYRGAAKPTWRDWKIEGFVGLLLVSGGNGLLNLAETRVDSVIAAIFIASNPIFMTLLSWGAGVQKRPTLLAAASLVGGLGGVSLLIFSTRQIESAGEFFGYAILLAGVICWTSGSVFRKKHSRVRSLWVASGIQMVCGGTVSFTIALVSGELRGFAFSQVSEASWYATLYLFVFGSLAGFTAYNFLLRECSPSAVSSHAWVNPIVAILLGWAILGESLSSVGWLASGIILASVFVLILQTRNKRSA